MSLSSTPPVVLFGYDSSTFTKKIRIALKLKQVPYTFVIVPSMMPRPILRDNFHLTYRKIPVLAIGREIYCDTSLILEALEHAFPAGTGYQSIYPPAGDGRNYRSIIRGFASYWTDRPLFRATTGLIPASVWRTRFGTDRAELIGHKLDPDKLERKRPRNLSSFDLHLSLLEPQLQQSGWVFSTPHPSLADIALYYQLLWGLDIAAGRGLYDLTASELQDTNTVGATIVFNDSRYPALHAWFARMTAYMAALPSVETIATDPGTPLTAMKDWTGVERELIPTPASQHMDLDEKNGLMAGVRVSVAPDDTGRDDPTIGTLVALSPEEIVIKPLELSGPKAPVDVRVHFPRLGFVVLPVGEGKGAKAKL